MVEWLSGNECNAYPFREVSGPVGTADRPLSSAVVDAAVFVTGPDVQLTYLSDPRVAPVTVEVQGTDLAYWSDEGTSETFGEWTVCKWPDVTLVFATERLAEFSWPASPTGMFFVQYSTNVAAADVQTFVLRLYPVDCDELKRCVADDFAAPPFPDPCGHRESVCTSNCVRHRR